LEFLKLFHGDLPYLWVYNFRPGQFLGDFKNRKSLNLNFIFTRRILMLKGYFLRPALTVWIVSLFSVSLVLTACGGAAESTSEAPVTPVVTEETIAQATEEQKAPATEKIATEEVATEETEATEVATEETEATKENVSTPEQDLPTAASTEAGCQAIEVPANDLIAAVSDTDWAKGPANALVTLIEYGDFQ
jgi:hypothetical protein